MKLCSRCIGREQSLKNQTTLNILLFWQVEIEATAEDPGTTLRAPTAEAGFAPACKDTCFGNLKLQMWERRYDGSKGKVSL